MRNSKTLLRATAAVMLSAACFLFVGTGAALADDSSAGPEAMVLFPVSEKPNTGTGMKPAVFNHALHENRITDCQTCHHTGDTVSCSTCHTVEGKEEGKFITLERAMHATNIAPRPKGEVTPKSCVSCHEEVYKETRECAGCHAIVKPRRDEKWCASCHYADVSAETLKKGAANELDITVRGELAKDATKQRKSTDLLSSTDGPLTVTIGELSEKYEPNRFNHRRHVASLMDRISGKDNQYGEASEAAKLAEAFHNQPEILCATCHHNSPLSKTPPKCITCHSKEINPAAPERPTLKAAYHLQCMGCHEGMNVARPQKSSCVTCHKVKTDAK